MMQLENAFTCINSKHLFQCWLNAADRLQQPRDHPRLLSLRLQPEQAVLVGVVVTQLGNGQQVFTEIFHLRMEL